MPKFDRLKVDVATNSRRSSVLAILAIVAAGALLVTAGSALAVWASSNAGYGNGHNGVTFGLYTQVSFNSGFSGWNAGQTDATMWVTNSDDAQCDRSRLFSNGWTQIGNKNWAGNPFPVIAADGNNYDYFLWDYPAAAWALRAWWQIDDAFVGGVCDYGGGRGVVQDYHNNTAYSETVPSP